jgi:hypothetical protein
MADTRDKVVDEIRRIRRRISERLLKARKEGREFEELGKIEREGMRWYRSETKDGHGKNGRKVRH